MDNKLLNEALRLICLGLSVIPVRGKACLLPGWKEYQTRKPTKDEIEKWFFELNPTGIAIITGAASGVVVLDAEKDANLSKFDIPRTPTAKTGGGGFHYYFKAPAEALPNRVRFLPNVDFRGEGGYAACPPSQHKSGGKYEWLINFDETPLADIPEWLINELKAQSQPKNWEQIFDGVPEGERHTNATSVTGLLLKYLPPEKWQSVALPCLKGWNLQNVPPLPQKELNDIFRGIADKELSQRKPRPTQSNDNTPLSVSVKDIFGMDIPKNQFLVDKLVPLDGITALTGHPECGKSWLMLHIAKCVASGKEVLGLYKTIQGSVLIVDEENGFGVFKERMRMLDFEPDLPVYFCTFKNLKVDNPDDLKKLLNEAKSRNVKLVVFDPFIAMHSGEENRAEDAQKVMEALQQFNLIGVTVIFIHHHRKDGVRKYNASQSIRGSSALSGRLDSHIAVSKKEKDQISELEIIQEKLRRDRKIKPFKVILRAEDEKMNIEFAGELNEAEVKKEEAKKYIVNLLADQVMAGEDIRLLLKEECNIGDRNCAAALRELVKDETIGERWFGKKKEYFIDLSQDSDGEKIINLDETVTDEDDTFDI